MDSDPLRGKLRDDTLRVQECARNGIQRICAAASVLLPQLRQCSARSLHYPILRHATPQCTESHPQELKNTRRRAISTLEVRPMGQKSGPKPDVAIRREWLRKVKEMWEKRKRRKREKK